MSLSEVERRRNAAETYYANYQKHLVERNLAKASEDIWGVVNQLASALSILLRGKPISTHRELREFIKQVAYAKGDEKLPELLQACEMLHVNYFHQFMEDEMFESHRLKAEELIMRLQAYIAQELQCSK